MRFHLLSTCLIASLLFTSQSGSAQEKSAVGSKAPGFTLQDQSGKPQTLDELLKGHNLALVFHRSADW